jgi:hypothetical protein
MFRSLFHDHLQGSFFVLSAFTTFQLPASSFVFVGFVAVCPLLVCVSGVAVCGLSGRALHHLGATKVHFISNYFWYNLLTRGYQASKFSL